MNASDREEGAGRAPVRALPSSLAGVPRTEQAARSQIVAAARRLDALGLNHGSTGNLSLRWHRGARDGLLVTPSAMPADAIGADDIVWLPLYDDDPLEDSSRSIARRRWHPLANLHRKRRCTARCIGIAPTPSPRCIAMRRRRPCCPACRPSGSTVFRLSTT